MNIRTTLLLFMLVLVVGSFIYYFEHPLTSQVETADSSLLQIPVHQIKSVQIEKGDAEIHCLLSNGTWHLVSPVQAPANPERIESFFYALEKTQSQHSIPLPKKSEERTVLFQEYGLAAPFSTIVLSSPSTEQRIYIGTPVVYGEGLYAFSSLLAEHLIILPESILKAIPERPDTWRSRQLVKSTANEVSRFAIDSSKGYILLQKEPHNEWDIKKPVDAPADRIFVMNYLKQLTELSVDRFVADQVSDLSVYGLRDPQLSLTLWTARGQREQIAIGDSYANGREGVYVQVDSHPSSVFGVTLAALENLTVTKELFRDRRLFPLAYGTVEAFELNTQKHDLRFELFEGDWKMTAPVVVDADDEKVSGFVKQCLASEIKSFEPLGSSANETNGTEIFITFYTRPSSLASEFVPVPAASTSPSRGTNTAHIVMRGDDVYTSILGGETKVGLTAPFVDGFTDNPLDYRDLRVFGFSPSNVVELSLYQARETNPVWKISRKTHNESFSVNIPADGWMRQDQANILLAAICDLKAESYVMFNTGDISLFGLAPPRSTLTMGFAGGQGIRKSVLFGKQTTGERVYATVRGSDVVFTLKQKLMDRLFKLVVDVPSEQQDLQEANEFHSGK